MIHNLLAEKWNLRLAAYLVAMLCCNLLQLSWWWPHLPTGDQDFTIYYMAGKLVQEGRAAALYDPAVQYESQRSFTLVPRNQRSIPYNHPPFESLLFVPFTWLRYWPAYLVWSALNLLMLAVSVVLLRRFPTIRKLPPPLLGLGCLAFFPISVGLILGQDIFLLLLLMVLALRSLDQGNDALAGVWLGAGLFRPQMVVPLVLLLAVRHWRVLLGFVSAALALLGISNLLMGWRWPWVYLDFVFRIENGKESPFRPQHIPNLRGLIASLPGLHLSGTTLAVSVLVTSLAVFALALRRIRKEHDSVSYVFCLALVTSVLVSFHSLYYDFTLLAPLAMFLLATFVTREAREKNVILLMFLVYLFFSPLYLNVDRPFWSSLIPIGLFLRLLRMPAPAGEPA
jgi:hypothetical protein